jgi:hypothetical protein
MRWHGDVTRETLARRAGDWDVHVDQGQGVRVRQKQGEWGGGTVIWNRLIQQRRVGIEEFEGQEKRTKREREEEEEEEKAWSEASRTSTQTWEKNVFVVNKAVA